MASSNSSDTDCSFGSGSCSLTAFAFFFGVTVGLRMRMQSTVLPCISVVVGNTSIRHPAQSSLSASPVALTVLSQFETFKGSNFFVSLK